MNNKIILSVLLGAALVYLEGIRMIVTKFRFSGGSPFATHEILEGTVGSHGAELHYVPSSRESQQNNISEAKRVLRNSSWNKIIQRLCDITKDWDSSYNNPAVMDGYSWSFSLCFDNGEEVIFSGNNAFPKNWNCFIRLVKRLVKSMK